MMSPMSLLVYLTVSIFVGMVALVVYKRVQARYAMQTYVEQMRDMPPPTDAQMWGSDDDKKKGK